MQSIAVEAQAVLATLITAHVHLELPKDLGTDWHGACVAIGKPGASDLAISLSCMCAGTGCSSRASASGSRKTGRWRAGKPPSPWLRLPFGAYRFVGFTGFVFEGLGSCRGPGFWKVATKNLATGIAETWDSLWKPGYLKRVQKYCPSIQLQDLEPYPAGIRAQAVLRDGTLVHDFLFADSPRSLHVCNAPSPAATSAIPIGNYICDKVINSQEDNPETGFAAAASE